VRGLVRSAFDFRGVTERTEALCGMTDVTVHSLPSSRPWWPRCTRSPQRTGSCRKTMRSSWMPGLLSRLCAGQYAALPRAVRPSASKTARRLVIHCTARQGPHRFGLRLILHALAVPTR